MIKYDTDRQVAFEPHNLELEGRPSKCLLIFDDEIWEDYVLRNHNLKVFPAKNTAGRVVSTYRYIDFNGEQILLVCPPTGAAASVCEIELLIASGVNKFVAFGTCGRLDNNIARNTIILPTAAYREEGASYHYLPDSDEISTDQDALKVAQHSLRAHGFTTLIGKVWTTDAVYRETISKIQLMKRRGCIAVDMELSALLAISAYRGIKFTEFLIGEDAVVDNATDALKRDNAKIFQAALEIVNKI